MSDVKRSPLSRRYLIDKRFQIKYTLLVVFVSAIIFSALGYKLYQKELANTAILKIQNMEVEGLVQSQDAHILLYLGGFFLLQVISLFVLGVLITHRIAGPVHRVHKYLEDAAQSGVLPPLESVRSEDEFQEFFESLSALISRYQAKSESQRKKAEELKQALAEAKSDPGQLNRCQLLCNDLLSLL